MFGRSALEISDFALSGQGIRTEEGESMSDAMGRFKRVNKLLRDWARAQEIRRGVFAIDT